jgi:caa(3)-type oxidase subunit IV
MEMATETKHHPNYLAVWAWVMGLAIVSVLASQLHLPSWAGALIIYGAAVIKAMLVALYFMHLRWERVLIVTLVTIPLLLFIVLTVSLLPDFVFAG